jgi:hypothetical protein
MIEKLKYYIESDKNGNVIGNHPPTGRDVADKLNQVIDQVNDMAEDIKEIKEHFQFHLFGEKNYDIFKQRDWEK